MSGRQEKARRHETSSRHVISSTERWGEQSDKASARDRLYFELHQARTWYVRLRIPGEYGPYEARADNGHATHTLVTRFPGGRTREPMLLIRRRDYPSGEIPFEHLEAMFALSRGPAFVVNNGDVDDAGDAGGAA
jgi:hypothetical protein